MGIECKGDVEVRATKRNSMKGTAQCIPVLGWVHLEATDWSRSLTRLPPHPLFLPSFSHYIHQKGLEHLHKPVNIS